ncbi:MAG: TrkH family potassium uptake protein [Candidatus Omnitrophota bacterium]
MILKPDIEDVKIVGYYLGKVILGLALTMLVPIITGFLSGETNAAMDFILGMELALIIVLALEKICFTRKEVRWMHGMIIVSLSWIAAMFIGAIPLYLSGHYLSYMDACFEAMSGFATTGLTLVQDLDHMGYAHNLWRHMTMFIGGQGIIVIMLSLFTKAGSGAFRIYVGEARGEKIMPNVVNTARFIWMVSIIYLIMGTLALGAIGIANGMKPLSSLFHGVCIFMAGFDTGGFTPQSQNILYYHSLAYEVVIIVIMILGAINFKVHYHVWTGNFKEAWKNIELTVLFFTIFITLFITLSGLNQQNTYPSAMVLFRRGFYQLISAHTGTGYANIYSQQFIREWGNLALAGIIFAMALGGSSCSTTGGIKMIRIGIIFKALIQDIKRVILPERAVVVQSIHHVDKIFLEDRQVRSAFWVTLAYLILYGLGALIGMGYGYPFLDSLFESTSAAANVGLSCGITRAAMPTGLKITYIVQMWAGRLEFISVFTLFGFFVAALKGK